MKLLKKEIKDFFCNYKSWLLIIMISFIPYYYEMRKIKMQNIMYILFTTMAPLQYVYESFLTDIKTKSIVFIYNIRNSFIRLYFRKILLSFILLGVTFLLSLPYTIKYLKMIDFFWIIPWMIFCVSLMQIAAILSKGAEITSAVFTLGIAFILLMFLLTINNILIIILISICLALVSFFAAWKLSESNFYRTQI